MTIRLKGSWLSEGYNPLLNETNGGLSSGGTRRSEPVLILDWGATTTNHLIVRSALMRGQKAASGLVILIVCLHFRISSVCGTYPSAVPDHFGFFVLCSNNSAILVATTKERKI